MRFVAAVLCGLGLAAAFPPFDLAPVGWLAFGGFLWLVAEAAGRARALWLGYVFGLAFYSSVMWWLVNVELIAFYPLMLLEAFGTVLVAAVVFRFRDAGSWAFVVAGAGAWAVAEFIRVRWPFGGFPWATLGLSIESTPLVDGAQWIGASGWSVLIAATAAAGVALIRRKADWRPLAVLTGAGVVLGLAGAVWPAVAEGPPIDVAIVQGNSPCPGTHCIDERRLIYEAHLRLTSELPADIAELVVWPESSVGFSSHPLSNGAVAEDIGTQATRLGAHLLIGGDRADGDSRFINSNVLFDPLGEVTTEYRKMHPVPFGEYVPFRSLVDWIPAIDRIPRDMLSGEEMVVFDLPVGPVGSVISFEGAFARYERQAVQAGAQLIVVATNEASFGVSPATDQFLAISRVRSAELGVDIVHAAVTGKSTFVRGGEIGHVLPLFEEGVLLGQLRLRDVGPTLYARTGDVVQVLAMAGVAALVVADRIRSRTRSVVAP